MSKKKTLSQNTWRVLTIPWMSLTKPGQDILLQEVVSTMAERFPEIKKDTVEQFRSLRELRDEGYIIIARSHGCRIQFFALTGLAEASRAATNVAANAVPDDYFYGAITATERSALLAATVIKPAAPVLVKQVLRWDPATGQ